MAEENPAQEDKTEDASPERREEFRERGQIAVSREITSVFVLASIVVFFSFSAPIFVNNLSKMFVTHFESIGSFRVSKVNVINYGIKTWMEVLYLITPMFIVTVSIAIFVTLLQTRFNWSWKRLKPEFSRMNPGPGLKRMVALQALFELSKGVGKMTAVGLVGYLILFAEWHKVPGLLQLPVGPAWAYFGEIIKYLFWAVSGLLLVIALGDYIYNFSELEKKMKMTKQEVKEEFKRREVDPHLKARMRRVQRDMATRKALDLTREATVLVTNPTHYSIALKYELGMDAPIVVAKGVDFLALKMRELAKDLDIPIVENRPLARELYATVEDGQPIPDKLYKVVAEIIRYVFKLKGRKLSSKTPKETESAAGAVDAPQPS